MPLQFFDDAANETHGGRVASDGETATVAWCEMRDT
jgi:hypothetical protein